MFLSLLITDFTNSVMNRYAEKIKKKDSSILTEFRNRDIS